MKSKSLCAEYVKSSFIYIIMSRFDQQLHTVRERLEQARSAKSQNGMALNFGRIAKPLRGRGAAVEDELTPAAATSATTTRDKRSSWIPSFRWSINSPPTPYECNSSFLWLYIYYICIHIYPSFAIYECLSICICIPWFVLADVTATNALIQTHFGLQTFESHPLLLCNVYIHCVCNTLCFFGPIAWKVHTVTVYLKCCDKRGREGVDWFAALSESLLQGPGSLCNIIDDWYTEVDIDM